MPEEWRPTAPGKLFTSTKDWSLKLDREQVRLQVNGRLFEGDALAFESLGIQPGTFWAAVTVSPSGGQALVLDGIPNTAAVELESAVSKAAHAIRYRLRVAELLRNFDQAVEPISRWAEQARTVCKVQLKVKGWLTHEFKAAQGRSKPQGFSDLLASPEVVQHLGKQPPEVQAAFGLWRRDFAEMADGINDRHLAKEMQEFKAFFDHVEKSPLTEEQAKAVICFDNRVLLVASAGSGKTSTMVAKAGYALTKGYFAAHQILLLAFNNDAAAELRERIRARLAPLGLPADHIVAKTFHAFGLDIIGQGTGKRPTLAPWVESGRDLEALLAMVDDLKDRDPAFRTQWDLFRVVLGQDLPKFGKEHESPEAWDRETRGEGFWTLNNEVVKSRGEQLIANWLFYNGVRYQYEAPYKIETADAAHRQYRPDFYFPDIDTYLEHWALDQNGNPPPEFAGYKEGMAWKKSLHAKQGSKLLETTTAGLWSGKVFRYLAEELTKLGVALDPNPDRPAPGRQPIENPRLARTFRSFLTHVKSNRLAIDVLRQRLDAGVAGDFRFRHLMFLNLFEKIWAAWEERLRTDQCIDYDDMLGLAADCVERGQWASPYELVMVDEFQDASHARARLVASLLSAPGRCFFAVGDDWQSINRFAGSDLAVMTDFEAKFGHAVTLKLETTFRCPQSLCNISSAFVQKNPKQIRKKVRSAKADVVAPVRIVQVENEHQIRTAVAKRLADIAAEAPEGSKTVSVFVLGRYKRDDMYVPLSYDGSRLTLEFVTVHSSKGLEADHVILPRMTSETLGFPSRVADDPVLQLAMPGGDSYEHAEERRLFYVALTRARSSVTLITLAHKQSPFIAELVRDHRLEIYNLDGQEAPSEVCPSCHEGFVVQKSGRYGPFYSCSRFPRCKYKRNIPSARRARA